MNSGLLINCFITFAILASGSFPFLFQNSVNPEESCVEFTYYKCAYTLPSSIKQPSVGCVSLIFMPLVPLKNAGQ